MIIKFHQVSLPKWGIDDHCTRHCLSGQAALRLVQVAASCATIRCRGYHHAATILGAQTSLVGVSN